MSKKLDVESMFLSLIGSVNILKWYLKNNIDSISYIPSLGLDLTIAAIPKYKRGEILKGFNVDRILGILKRQRPDLYKVLIDHPLGRKWLGEQINSFRKRFL